MSDKPTAPPAEVAASAAAENAAPKVPAAPKALPEQNPAFKAMGKFTTSIALATNLCFVYKRTDNIAQVYLVSVFPRAIG